MRIIKLLNQSFQHFYKNNCTLTAAALSYYSLVAIAPIFFIVFFVLELFLSDIQTRLTVLNDIYAVFPPDVAMVIGNIIRNITNFEKPTSISGLIGIIILGVSATTIISQLQKALNALWEVPHPEKLSLTIRAKKRLIALFFLIILGILLLSSFIINTLINMLGGYFSFQSGFDPEMIYIANILISLVTVSILFTLLFKFLPDKNLPWKDLFTGGFITGMLYTIGKNLIGYLLGHAQLNTLYGTAGTVLFFLLWVYYSSVIFLYGASLTYIYSKNKKEIN